MAHEIVEKESTQGTGIPEPAKTSRFADKGFLKAGALLLATLALCGGLVAWQYISTHESTDDSFVDGHSSSISSRVEGTIAAVYVDDNQFVKRGDLLAKLDPRDYQVKVDQKKAAVDLARRKMDELSSQMEETTTNAQGEQTAALGDVNAASANLAAAKSALVESKAQREQKKAELASKEATERQAALDYDRYKKLDLSGAVSHRQLEQARTNFDVALAEVASYREALREAEMKVDWSRAQIDRAGAQVKHSIGTQRKAQAASVHTAVARHQWEEAKASLAQEESALKQAELNLSYTEIRAPISGHVGRKNLEVGQRVESGQALLSIFAEHPWITANFKETQVGHMHQGQACEVKVDSFDGITFHGHVESMAPASGAKYALLPPENATGNFTKIVQRIPVKIVLDQDSQAKYYSRLAPGMSCETTVIIK